MWRRAALWFLTHPVGMFLLCVPVFLLLWLPLRYFGFSWAVIVAVGCGCFVAGWAAARRYWRKNGYVPKL